jgi:hypothetical protein
MLTCTEIPSVKDLAFLCQALLARFGGRVATRYSTHYSPFPLPSHLGLTVSDPSNAQTILRPCHVVGALPPAILRIGLCAK